MARIFVSYRHEDSPGHSGRLYDRLVAEFGAADVYRDADKPKPGARIEEGLRSELANCDAFIAVVGPHWASAGDGSDNWMRWEISLALESRIPVFVVLVNDLRRKELPAALAALDLPEALEMTDSYWEEAVGRLFRAVHEALRAEALAPHCQLVAESLRQDRLVTVIGAPRSGAAAFAIPFSWYDRGEGIRTVLAALPGILSRKGYDPRLMLATSEPDDALESAFRDADEEYRLVEEEPAAFDLRPVKPTFEWSMDEPFVPPARTTIVKLPTPTPGLGLSPELTPFTFPRTPALLAGASLYRRVPTVLASRLWLGDVLFLGASDEDPVMAELLAQHNGSSGSAWIVGFPGIDGRFWEEHGVELVPGELADYGRALRRQVEALPPVD